MLMAYSVWDKMTKRDIDQATEKIVKLVSKGNHTYDKQRPQGQRKDRKNEQFLEEYLISTELRDHIVKSLQPMSCGDVQINESQDVNRTGNLMYIYFYECDLNKRGDKILDPKYHVNIYIKIEIISSANGGTCCLIISFHDAEYPGGPRYDQLPD